MYKISLLLLFLITPLHLQAGDTAFPRTAIFPLEISIDTPVEIGIASNLNPCLATSMTYPTFYHLSDGNHITFVFTAQGINPCSNQPGYPLRYDIGELSAGNYTAQVYFASSISDIPASIDEVDLNTGLGPLLNFEVRGPVTPAMVPINNGVVLFLMAGLFVFGLFVMKRKKKWVLMSMMIFVFESQAKEFILLISNDEYHDRT